MQLGKYEILEELGRGGFGIVYKAHDTALGRDVALKVLHPQLAADGDFVERFRREARLLAGLDHANIVTIYDFGEIEGRYFITMRYLSGGNLSQHIQKDNGLPYPEALRIMGQITSGLGYAHQRGLIHRDIKPTNILFDQNNNAVITDFGLAKVVQDSSSSSSSMGGVGVGTPYYKAPEIWRGEKPTPAADQYSLACVLVEMLTGKVLFDADSTPTVMLKHFEPLILPDLDTVKTPKATQEAILVALAKIPAMRHANLAEFFNKLNEISIDSKSDAHPDPGDIVDPVIIENSEPVQLLDETGKEHDHSINNRALIEQEKDLPKKNKSKKALMGVGISILSLGLVLVVVVSLVLLSIYLYPRSYINRNAQRSESSIGQMIEIPTGEFLMGSDNGYSDEQPEHEVYLDTYYIDKYEVTNAQFIQCEVAGYCSGSANKAQEYANHPVVNVNWREADEYCSWSGKRLPTEAEWEKAARGSTARIYPWGNSAPNWKLANFRYDFFPIKHTVPVGSYPAGASPYGVMDMAGNAWEWVADWYDSDYYSNSPLNNPTGPASGDYRVLRGGSWDGIGRYLRVSDRYYFNPSGAGYLVGFRCASSP